jgi:hypothetical protein
MEKGKVNTRDGSLNFCIFPSKLMMVMNVNKLYPEEKSTELAIAINKEIMDKSYFSYEMLSLTKDGEDYIKKMFNKYKSLESQPEFQDMTEIDLDSSNNSVKKLVKKEDPMIKEEKKELEEYDKRESLLQKENEKFDKIEKIEKNDKLTTEQSITSKEAFFTEVEKDKSPQENKFLDQMEVIKQ